MENSPLIAAGALVYCLATEKYLFLLRNSSKFKHTWGLVGGKIHNTESVVAGLYREILEETGRDLSSNKIIPIETFTSPDKGFLYHTYLIVVDQEFVPHLNDEHSGFAWTPLLQYPKPLHPGVWKTFSFKSIVSKIKGLEKSLGSYYISPLTH